MLLPGNMDVALDGNTQYESKYALIVQHVVTDTSGSPGTITVIVFCLLATVTKSYLNKLQIIKQAD